MSYGKEKITLCKSDAFTIMWFVSEKFRSDGLNFLHKPASDAGRHISQYFYNMDLENEAILFEYPDLKKVLKERKDKKKGSAFAKETFTKFRTGSLYTFLGKEKDEEVSIAFTQAFLDMLCLYGQSKSYKEYIKDSVALPILSTNRLKFIKTKLDYDDSSPVLDLMNFINKTVPKTSSGVKAKVNEIVSKTILEVIGHGMDKGYLIIRSEHYPDFLATMIQKSSYGFGINIPQYNNDQFWTENPVGKRILKINHNQFTNTTEKGSDDEDELTKAQGKYRYTRILFVSGEPKDQKNIDKEAKELIDIMRTQMVRVIIIFTSGLDDETKNTIDGLDACLLSIDGNPFLLGTEFIGDFHSHKGASNIKKGVEGVFYFKKQKAIDFFENGIQKILSNPIIEGNIIETYNKVEDGKIDTVWTRLNHSRRIETIRLLKGVFSA